MHYTVKLIVKYTCLHTATGRTEIGYIPGGTTEDNLYIAASSCTNRRFRHSSNMFHFRCAGGPSPRQGFQSCRRVVCAHQSHEAVPLQAHPQRRRLFQSSVVRLVVQVLVLAEELSSFYHTVHVLPQYLPSDLARRNYSIFPWSRQI